MQLVLKQVRKPIRELRKSLQDLPASVPRIAVHNLRTRSRRLEAISVALLPRDDVEARRLLKSIRPLRKAAGTVRSMDVLESKVLSLSRQHPDPSLKKLLKHLQATRAEQAHELAEEFASRRKGLRHSLKRFAERVEEHFSEAVPVAETATRVFEQIQRWPPLGTENLHAFRIKLKELRYILQLTEGANVAFMRALENARVRIGIWHDWEELHQTAIVILSPRGDMRAIQKIVEVESRKLAQAMRAAQSLRTRYLRTDNVLEIAEP